MPSKHDEKQTLSELKFYAAVLTATGEYTVQTFDTLDALTARVAELVDRDVTVFSFVGQQLKVSKPPFRHLLTPWGAKPLFAIPENLEPDDTGYLGVDPVHLESPPELPTAKNINKAESGDEFFSDDDDNVLDVFNKILPDPDS
jgi:hypothetical protein